MLSSGNAAGICGKQGNELKNSVDMEVGKIYETDPWLAPFKDAIEARHAGIAAEKRKLFGSGKISDKANNHLYYGLHFQDDAWVFREWAPNATRIYIIGDFNN